MILMVLFEKLKEAIGDASEFDLVFDGLPLGLGCGSLVIMFVMN